MDACAQVLHLEIIETLRVLVAQRHCLVDSQVEAANRIRARLRELELDALPAEALPVSCDVRWSLA